MTNEQAKKMLIAKLECLKRETSGTDFVCNNSNCDECQLCYEQGNMGDQKKALGLAIKALERQPCDDTISRQAAIDIERNATVDTNPSHFEAHQKFTQYLDDAEISSFGRWQWANGFNTALTAVVINLRKLPSAQPELAIPLQWIEAQIEWLKSLDNAFSTLTAGQISAMVNKWEDEQDG